MKNEINRRDFIKHVSLLPIAASLGIGGAPLMAQDAIKRVGGVKLKLSLNAYSFNNLLAANIKAPGTGMTLFELLEFCAIHNFDAIDPTGYYFPGYPKIPTDTFINSFKRKAFQLGLDISGTGVRNNFASPDKDKRSDGIQLVKAWVEVAAKLGAPVLRVFAGAVPAGYENKWDTVAEWMIEAFAECTEYGKKFGVIIGVQNHGDMLQTGDQTLEIVKKVNSDWFGVIVDTGNFKTKDPYLDIERVAPFAVNWQIKESVFGRTSDVKVDLIRLLRIIRKSGYRGYIPIETLVFADRPYDPYTLVPAFLSQVQEAVAKTA